jgi:hypothetical protein
VNPNVIYPALAFLLFVLLIWVFWGMPRPRLGGHRR